MPRGSTRHIEPLLPVAAGALDATAGVATAAGSLAFTVLLSADNGSAAADGGIATIPSMPRANTFNGGTNAVAITTGNSGGTSGDVFQLVSSTAPTYSTTQAAHGGMSMACTQPGTFAAIRTTWTGLGALTSDVYFRTCVWIPALPGTGPVQLFRGLNNAAAQCFVVMLVATTGVGRFANAANGGIFNATVAVPTSTWFRVEARVRPAIANGQVEYRLYNTADSITIADTASNSAAALAANIDQVEFGMSNAGPTSVTWYFDDVAVSTSGWIGPPVVRPMQMAMRRPPPPPVPVRFAAYT